MLGKATLKVGGHAKTKLVEGAEQVELVGAAVGKLGTTLPSYGCLCLVGAQPRPSRRLLRGVDSQVGQIYDQSDDKPRLKRRLSNADFRETLPPESGPDEKRRFFRTWVRVVPTSKAEDLRRRLGEVERRELEATTNIK